MEETRSIIAIVVVGMSLGGLTLTSQRVTRAELVALREHLEGLLEGDARGHHRQAASGLGRSRYVIAMPSFDFAPLSTNGRPLVLSVSP